MLSQDLGFTTSWKMLTRDKGWIKPLLVLTLVSWIPILGQIVVIGYGLEWARLTAWGVDSAPKQRGVAYGKVFTTGGIAFLVMLSMGIVLGLVNIILFGSAYIGTAFPLSMGVAISDMFGGNFGSSLVYGGGGLFAMLVMLVVNMFFGTFISAAMMRATLYDSFAAGWRLDRILQMIGRDLGGFVHTYAVSLIGGLVTGVASGVVAFVGALFAVGGVLGLAAGAGHYSYDMGTMFLRMGAFPILVIVVLAIVAFFAIQVLAVAMQLVSMNAVGQWFCRFDVNRWGVSAAPLPDDVPHVRTPAGGPYAAAPSMPTEAVNTNVDQAVGTGTQAGAPAGTVHQPVADQPTPSAETAPVAGPAAGVASEEPVTTALDTPQDAPAEEAPTTALQDSKQEGVASTDEESVDETHVEDAAADAPAQEPVAEKKPIPLGPISDAAQDPDSEGPIQA